MRCFHPVLKFLAREFLLPVFLSCLSIWTYRTILQGPAPLPERTFGFITCFAWHGQRHSSMEQILLSPLFPRCPDTTTRDCWRMPTKHARTLRVLAGFVSMDAALSPNLDYTVESLGYFQVKIYTVDQNGTYLESGKAGLNGSTPQRTKIRLQNVMPGSSVFVVGLLWCSLTGCWAALYKEDTYSGELQPIELRPLEEKYDQGATEVLNQLATAPKMCLLAEVKFRDVRKVLRRCPVNITSQGEFLLAEDLGGSHADSRDHVLEQYLQYLNKAFPRMYAMRRKIHVVALHNRTDVVAHYLDLELTVDGRDYNFRLTDWVVSTPKEHSSIPSLCRLYDVDDSERIPLHAVLELSSRNALRRTLSSLDRLAHIFLRHVDVSLSLTVLCDGELAADVELHLANGLFLNYEVRALSSPYHRSTALRDTLSVKVGVVVLLQDTAFPEVDFTRIFRKTCVEGRVAYWPTREEEFDPSWTEDEHARLAALGMFQSDWMRYLKTVGKDEVVPAAISLRQYCQENQLFIVRDSTAGQKAVGFF